MNRFFTESLSALEPYTPGEQPQDQRYLKLNTNESPFPPSPMVAQKITKEEIDKLRLYPDPGCRGLCQAIAETCEVEPEQVMVGNGSDENLAFAFRAFCDETHGVAFPDITYGFYPVWAKLFHIPALEIPLEEDFSLNPERYYGLNRTIVIANPNAPTGLALSPEQIEGILKANPDHVVVIDEAYVDFGGESCVPLVNQYDNLLVVRTFSKSRSLAGGRLGFAIGNPQLIADLNRVKFSLNPYNINRLTLLAGEACLGDTAYFSQCVREIEKNRQWTAQRLKELGFTLTDSKANFVFAQTPRMEGKALYQALKQKGVLVRRWDQDRIANWLRISIGTDKQMRCFIDCVKEILEGTNADSGD